MDKVDTYDVWNILFVRLVLWKYLNARVLVIALSLSQPFWVERNWTRTGTEDSAISKSVILSEKQLN